MPPVYWGTTGTASVVLTIPRNPEESLNRTLNGCFVKNDANLKRIVEDSIDPSADRSKYENSKYLFYSPVSNVKGVVTEAVISYEQISLTRYSKLPVQKGEEITLKNPLVITFDEHFFLCCDSEDLNQSKFLEEYSKEVRGTQTLNPKKSFFGLGRENYLLQFLSFEVSQSQNDLYDVNEKCVFNKLKVVGPLLLHDNKTVMGWYQKRSNCRIKTCIFEKAPGDPPPDLPSPDPSERHPSPSTYYLPPPGPSDRHTSPSTYHLPPRGTSERHPSPSTYHLPPPSSSERYPLQDRPSSGHPRGNLDPVIGNMMSVIAMRTAAYIKKEKYDEAISCGEKLLAMAQESGDKHAERDAYMALGKTYFEKEKPDINKKYSNKEIKGMFDNGIAYYNKYLDLANEPRDEEPKMDVYMMLGVAHLLRWEYDKAISYSKKGQALANKYDNDMVKEFAQKALELAYSRKEDSDDVISEKNDRLDKAQKSGDKIAEMNVYRKLGDAYLTKQNYDEAISNSEKCLAIAEEYGDKEAKMKAYQTIADAHFHKTQYDDAISYSTKSLAIAEESGDELVEMKALITLGNAHLQKQEYHDAISYSDKLLFFAQRCRLNVADVARMVANKTLGEAYVLIGEYDKALSCSEAYFANAEELSDTLDLPSLGFSVGHPKPELQPDPRPDPSAAGKAVRAAPEIWPPTLLESQAVTLDFKGGVHDLSSLGVLLQIPPNAVTYPTDVECYRFSPDLYPPTAQNETLVSYCVGIRPRALELQKPIIVTLNHSGPSKKEGYETIVKAMEPWSKSQWKQIQEIREDSPLAQKHFESGYIEVEISKWTALAVVTRLIIDVFEVTGKGCVVRSSVCDDVKVEFPEGAVDKKYNGSMKLLLMPDHVDILDCIHAYPCPLLQINGFEGVRFEIPVTIRLPHPYAAGYPSGNVRLLTMDGTHEWKDITDQVHFVENESYIGVQVSHFSWLWVWIYEVPLTVASSLSQYLFKVPQAVYFAVVKETEAYSDVFLTMTLVCAPNHMQQFETTAKMKEQGYTQLASSTAKKKMRPDDKAYMKMKGCYKKVLEEDIFLQFIGNGICRKELPLLRKKNTEETSVDTTTGLVISFLEKKDGDAEDSLCTLFISPRFYDEYIVGPSDTPSEKVLNDLSQEISSIWKNLGRQLEVDNNKIEEISRDHISYSGVSEKAFQMLLLWKESSQHPSYSTLGNALIASDKRNLARKYCSMS